MMKEPEALIKQVVQIDVNGDDSVIEEPVNQRPVRERRAPDMYGEWVNLTFDKSELSSVSEAMARIRKSPKKRDF